jgi:hypothetical protein
MSSSLLRIIPRDPAYVPSASARKQACAILKRLVPEAEDVQAIVHEGIEFVDQGENFEEVRCPSCKKRLDTDWWREAMVAAGDSDFTDLTVRVPCCRSQVSLNDLDYRWPAGFARFVLEASEPALAGVLDDRAVAQIEAVLGQPVRQILTRY